MNTMKAVEVGVSPKQMSKLRNGHKVRVKPAMEGKGVCMIVTPSKYDIVTRAFSKGKGAEISLSPEEIMSNLNAVPQMEGRGVFNKVKKAAKVVAKSPIARAAASKAIDLAASYAPQLGASALSGLALMAGQPELVPVAAKLGSKLGGVAGQQGAKAAKGAINKKPSSKLPPSQSVSSSVVDDINDSQGSNMGYMERAGLASTDANRQRAMMMKGLEEDKFRQLYPNSNISDQDIDKVFSAYPSGSGLYAAPSSGRGMMPKRNMKNLVVGRGFLPQAMTSQPYDANFQFRHTLPPAYQMIGKGLYA